MGVFTSNRRLPEVIYALEKEFEEDVYLNSKLFFGEKSILLDNKTLLKGKLLGGTIPDGFLFDLSDDSEPQFYIIEVELAKHSFNSHIFPQITKFFSFFKNQQQRQQLTTKLYEIIDSDKSIRSQFRKLLGSKEIFKFLNDVIENSQNILIVIDGEKTEISEMSEVYTETWGKMVKHLVLRKYSDGKDTIYHMEPDFEVLEIVGDEKIVTERAAYNEEHHTDGVSEQLKDVYEKLKSSVLSINEQLIFNPTKFYISIRHKKGVAYITINKKNIRVVIMRPESEIREHISRYEVKSFTEGVKKFWGGECAAIVMKDAENIDEVVELLRPLVQRDE